MGCSRRRKRFYICQRGKTEGILTGTITLKKGENLYVYVGGAGNISKGSTESIGGYNGGGNGGAGNTGQGGSGGGATDIRLGGTTYYDRVIVAGGGGGSGGRSGASYVSTGGVGGGTNGKDGTSNENVKYVGGGATQTTGGLAATYTGTAATGTQTAGSFGTGGTGGALTNGNYGAGGGGRWLVWRRPEVHTVQEAGGGGSGFVWTSSTASNVPTGYSVPTTYYLTNASTTAGSASMPTHDGTSTMTGNTGNGYARITWIGFGDDETTDGGYVTSGLVLHYDGINNTGNGHSGTTTTWKDLSGNNNDGRLSKATGNNFYWESNNITLSNVSSTLGTYVDTPLNLNGKERTIFYTIDANGLKGSVWGDTDSGNKYGLFNYETFVANRGDSTSTQDRISYTFNKSGIYNYAVTLSSTEIKLYVNGALTNTTTNTIGLKTSNNLRILSAYYSSQNATNLKMYNFMVYDRPLTDKEVLENYKIDKSLYGF